MEVPAGASPSASRDAADRTLLTETPMHLAQTYGDRDFERQRIEDWENDSQEGGSRNPRDQWFRDNRPSTTDRQDSNRNRGRVIRQTTPSRTRWDDEWRYQPGNRRTSPIYSPAPVNRSRSTNCFSIRLTTSRLINSRDVDDAARTFFRCEYALSQRSSAIYISNISQHNTWNERLWVVSGLVDQDAFTLSIDADTAQVIAYERRTNTRDSRIRF
jgi:hypothetical protein